MAGYIGTQPVPQATQTRDSFTATAGQTSFATSGYAPGFLDVYLNGIKLAAADYTAGNGSDVVLASGAALDDILEVVAYTTFEAANVTGADDFTVTGSFTSRGIDDNATSIAMTLDSSGNVGIGTSSPKGQGVHIVPSGGDTALVLSSSTGDTNSDEVNLVSLNKVNTGFQPLNLKAYTTRFHTNGSERMRIDSSGNLLVGKTSTATGAGFEARSDGQIVGTRSSNRVAFLNRLTSDGDIVQFAKDGSTVGSIGTFGGRIYLADDNQGGISFSSGSKTLFSTNNVGSVEDAAMDIGSSSYRFKDLYLSGGVYLGGTGSANKLDDYEEGDFQPYFSTTGNNGSISYSAQQGTYTKIGRRVFFWFDFTVSSWSGASGVPLISLPFASSGTSEMGAFTPWDIHNNYTGSQTPTQWISQNSSWMRMYTWTGDTAMGHNPWAVNQIGRVSGSVSYTSS